MQKVNVQFFSRRQNTNQGDDQYRLWFPRAEADRVAVHVPQLMSSLQQNTTWSERVDVTWINGSSPQKMAFAAYADQSGEMSFTASNKTKLFDFAADRHTRGTEGQAIDAAVTIDNGTVVSIQLDLTL